MTNGTVAIVLNAHFPYVRNAGRWPHGEDALAAVIAESYVPLLHMLVKLQHAQLSGSPSHPATLPFTLSISPVLLEQLAAPSLMAYVARWIKDWRVRAEHDLAQFTMESDGHGSYLARFWLDWIDTMAYTLHEHFDGNLLTALRNTLTNTVDILLAPATAAFLPRLPAAAVRAQLKTGVPPLLRHLGRRPVGLWLPGSSGTLDMALANELGVRYAIGVSPQANTTSASLPYIRADRRLTEQVVGPGIGYPGDGLYREFHRRHAESGLAYWRVTNAETPLHAKERYDPYVAFGRADEHAVHFVQAIMQRLDALAEQDQPPVVVLAFDAELFGHWWFEGVHWLQRVLELLQATSGIMLSRPSQLEALPLASSGGTSRGVFDDPALGWLWQRVAAATDQVYASVTRLPAAEGMQEALLTQAGRELLLAQSGDWAALWATGAAPDYAARRLDEHLERCARLLYWAEHDPDTPEAVDTLAQIATLDDVFSVLNYRVFV